MLLRLFKNVAGCIFGVSDRGVVAFLESPSKHKLNNKSDSMLIDTRLPELELLAVFFAESILFLLSSPL